MKLTSCNGLPLKPLLFHMQFLDPKNNIKGSLLDDTDDVNICASCLQCSFPECTYCSKLIHIIKIWCTPRGRGKSKQVSSVPEFSIKNFDGKLKYMLSMWSHFNRSPIKLLPNTDFKGQLYDGYIKSFILSLCLQTFAGYTVCKLPMEDDYIHVFDTKLYQLTASEQQTLYNVFMSLRVQDAAFFEMSALPVFTHHYHNTLWTSCFISNITSFDLLAIFNELMDSRERSGQNLLIIQNAKKLFDIESLEETFMEETVYGKNNLSKIHGKSKRNLSEAFDSQSEELHLRSLTPDISSALPNIHTMANSTQQAFNNNSANWFLKDSNINLYEVDYANMDGLHDSMFGDSPLKKTNLTDTKILKSSSCGNIEKISNNDSTTYIPPFIPNGQYSLDNYPLMMETEWTMNTFIQSLIVEKNFRFINRRLHNFFEESFGNLTQVNYIALKKFIIMVVPENIVCPEAGCNFIKKFMLKLV